MGGYSLTGPPGYLGRWNRFLVIDSWAPSTCINSGSAVYYTFSRTYYNVCSMFERARLCTIQRENKQSVLRIRIRDPGSGAFLTPGSGIRDPEWVFSGSRISDPGSRIPIPYFEELFDNFFGKKFYNSGIRCLFDPGIRNGFFPDPGSQDHILKSFLTIFWVKISIIFWKLAQIFFFSTSKLK